MRRTARPGRGGPLLPSASVSRRRTDRSPSPVAARSSLLSAVLEGIDAGEGERVRRPREVGTEVELERLEDQAETRRPVIVAPFHDIVAVRFEPVAGAEGEERRGA